MRWQNLVPRAILQLLCPQNDSGIRNVRERFVVQEANTAEDAAFFATIQRWERQNCGFRSVRLGASGVGELNRSCVDIKKAKPVGETDRSLFIRLPPGVWYAQSHPGKFEPLHVVRSNVAAAQSGKMPDNWGGVVPGTASPCSCWHPTWQLRCVVHSDDSNCPRCGNALDGYGQIIQNTLA